MSPYNQLQIVAPGKKTLPFCPLPLGVRLLSLTVPVLSTDGRYVTSVERISDDNTVLVHAHALAVLTVALAWLVLPGDAIALRNVRQFEELGDLTTILAVGRHDGFKENS